LIDGPVYARLADCPADLRKSLPQIQPMTLLPFVRKGIDVYSEPFEVTLFAEGTIRGTGGLRIVGDRCETTVPGLFAAGDTATRELIAGAVSGGGAPNSAWALTSGLLSGQASAELARRHGRRASERARAEGTAGLRPRSTARKVDRRGVLKAAQDEILPLDKNVFDRERSSAILSCDSNPPGKRSATTTTQRGPTPSSPARPRRSLPRLVFATRRRLPARRAAACTSARTPRASTPARRADY